MFYGAKAFNQANIGAQIWDTILMWSDMSVYV